MFLIAFRFFSHDLGIDLGTSNVLIFEDGKGIIIRIYENTGADCNITLRPNFRFQRASVVDLMENEVTECAVSGGTISASLKPFEILSIKVN